jgi:chromosome partitioning protein
MSTIISITNQKGGVGKTTTAVNLAAGFARAGFSTLLIDFDPQGHATEHLGLRAESEKTQKSVLNILQNNQTIAENLVQTYIPNLQILPANLRLGLYNQNNPQGKQFSLKESFTPEILDKFNFVVIDCQASCASRVFGIRWTYTAGSNSSRSAS